MIDHAILFIPLENVFVSFLDYSEIGVHVSQIFGDMV